jgi:hypothetical protein
MDREEGQMGLRLSRAGVLVAVAALVVACGTLFGKTYTLQLAGTEPGIDPMFVTIEDRTGDLQDVTQAIGFPGGAKPDGPTWNPPDQPNQVLVSWAGGACDESVTMTLTKHGAGYQIAMATQTTGGACTMQAIPRDVLLIFKQPTDAKTVTLVAA